jgi:predicted nucleic acid-binding protein
MVFLDANILLEQLLPNRPRTETVTEALATLDALTCVTTLTVHLVLHFGRLDGVPDKLLHEALARQRILPLAPEDYIWARDNEIGKDFEDALQVAAALRSKSRTFMTLDRPLAKNYSQYMSMLVPK